MLFVLLLKALHFRLEFPLHHFESAHRVHGPVHGISNPPRILRNLWLKLGFLGKIWFLSQVEDLVPLLDSQSTHQRQGTFDEFLAIQTFVVRLHFNKERFENEYNMW